MVERNKVLSLSKQIEVMEKLKEYNVYEELVMDYSPILGVTYGLKNVTPENEDEGPEYDSAGFSIEDRE